MMSSITQSRQEIGQRMIAAARAGALSYARQPIVPLRPGGRPMFEVLSRFDGLNLDPSYNVGQLFGIAEETGAVVEMDLATAKAAIAALSVGAFGEAGLSVNASGQSIQNPQYVAALIEALKAARFDPARFTIEITESAEIKDLPATNAWIQAVRAMGCKVSLDDFGAGFASLPYLQALEVDGVKIDGRYLQAASASQRDERLFRAIVRFCAELGVETVAEMIETEAQADFAARIGATAGQGYYLGRPERCTILSTPTTMAA
jgi:EAL domain-containing protein (putative c-di-GMP-specific phosphodiesterase class I)